MKKPFSKLLSYFLSVVMILGVFIAVPIENAGAYTSHSRDEAVAWAKSQIGSYIDVDGAYGAQCVDLIKAYYKYLGVSPVLGNGCDYSHNSLPNGWTRIQNTPTFVPDPGDIVVWTDAGWKNGHVAIFLSGNTSSFTSIDQNWPQGSAVKEVSHNYKYVWGVIRPDFPGNPIKILPNIVDNRNYAIPATVNASHKIDTYNEYGNQESGRFIGQNDKCNIDAIYVNGYVHVQYPANGASEPNRWTFARLDDFTDVLPVIEDNPPGPQGHVMSESEAAGRTIPDGDYYIISEISQDYFIDIPGDNFDTPNGKNVEMWIWDSFMPDRNGYDCFHIEYLNNGFYSIRQFGTNMCVDVNGASLSMGENIQMWENNGSNAQQWSIERTSHGYRMRSRCNAYYMDIENGIYGGSTNIRCWEGNDSKAQSFSFIPRDLNERPVSDGVYTIKTKVDRNCFLDVADVPGNFYAGSNIQIWKAAPGDPEEKYTIKYASDGWYRICEKTSGLLMELADPNSGFLEASRNVQLFSDNGGNHQLWKIRQNSDGTYFIINKASGYYLDLEGENTNNGTNVSQHPYNGNNNQRWLIESYTNTYTISFSEENITMKKGNSKIVNINFTGDDIYTLEYQLNNSNVCTAQWGDVDYGTGTTSVTINAVGAGSTTVAIRLKDSNDKILFSKNINVTVTGDPYSISFSADNLTMKKDSSKTVNIRFTGENIYTLSYDLSNSNICTAQWGGVDYGTGTTSITINAIGAGNAFVTINLKDCDDKILFSKKITISVTAPTYTISYNVNQGYGEFTSQIKTDGLSLTLSSVKPTRTGYEFLGWSTNPNATTAEYQPGSSFSKNENTTLYAVWKATSYTVSYNMNGGNGSISSQTKMYGQDLILSSTKPTRTGYEFIGWNINSSATSAQYQPNDKYTTNSSVTLYAVWKSNTYTISYNMNGGSGSINPQIVVYGQSVTISGVIPTRAGYQFLGWNTSANATVAQYQPGSKYTSSNSVILYAIWKKLAENTPQIIVENKTASAGSEVKVNVSLKNNPGISSMGLNLKYDKTKLTLKAVNYNSAMGGQSMQPQTMDSPVILNWVSPVADYSGDGTYAELVFKVSDKAKSGTVSIEITYDSNNVYNLNDENIAFEVKNGTVTVSDYIPGDINNDGVVNNKDFSRLFQYLSGWNVVINEAALDVNGDGSVNNKDATRLFQYVSGWNVNIY